MLAKDEDPPFPFVEIDLIGVTCPTAPPIEIDPFPAVKIKAVEPTALSSTVPVIEIDAPVGDPPAFVVSSVMLTGDPLVPKITLSLIVIGDPSVMISAFKVVVDPGPSK